MVGPVSLGEQIQKLVHEITTANNSQGWHGELDNMPISRITRQRNWRLRDGLVGRTEYEMVGLVQEGAGTRRSNVGTGLALRVGIGLEPRQLVLPVHDYWNYRRVRHPGERFTERIIERVLSQTGTVMF